MAQATKDEERRARARDYEARLAAARESAAVLSEFARAREACGGGALEVAFAATAPEPDGAPLPAAIWVALRQGDLDAVVDLLVEHATEQFVLAEHEQLDANYRLTSVAESRGLPDVDRLTAQLASFVDVPRDVVLIVCDWGADDPRTAAEIDRLMAQRHGAGRPATSGTATGLAMTSSELAALLSLSPEQQAMLSTLVRQADITVSARPIAAAPGQRSD
jgi:hypothetical protein